MTRGTGSLREVHVRLLRPMPLVDDKRLDELLDHRTLARVHFMFMLLAATELELMTAQWTEICLPKGPGPKHKDGADWASQHRSELSQLCSEVGLALPAGSWVLRGQVDPPTPLTVDTRSLMRLTLELEESLRQKELDLSVQLIRDLKTCAPDLIDYELHNWKLAQVFHAVHNEVPADLDGDAAEAFRRNAPIVTKVGELESAIKAVKCQLPLRLFELLLDELRIDEASEVLPWISPRWPRARGLEARLRNAAYKAGTFVAAADRPTWVGMDGGPTRTAMWALRPLGTMVVDDWIPAGIGGSMGDDELVRSAQVVMGRLNDVVGEEPCHAVVGCAGFDPENPGTVLRALADARAHYRNKSDLWVGNDADLLLFAPPLLGNGIAVIADVGSAVVAMNDQRDVVRRGGDEWLLADPGSGYEIAIAALRRMLDQSDHSFIAERAGGYGRQTRGKPLHPDAVALIVAARHIFGVPSPHGELDAHWCLRVMRRIARQQAVRWDKSVIASFAGQVLKEADNRNKLASAVVRTSAEGLGRQLGDVLAWHPDPSPRLVVVGWLAMDSELYFDALQAGARKQLRSKGAGTSEIDQKLGRIKLGETGVDARERNASTLFAGLARMLAASSASDLAGREADVVQFLRRERSPIVEHIPSN